jgi:membrane protein DedA with SNARE-associated domain
VTHFFTTHGLPLLFAVVMLESFGVPLPGETALIAFGVLASQGNYSIWLSSPSPPRPRSSETTSATG